MIYRYIFFLILGIDATILLYEISELSISYHEASVLYGNFSFLYLIEKFSFFLFGQNDFALRIMMIVFHLFSVVLLYKISEKYLKHQRDRLWLVFIFVLLPGVTSSAILVDSAGFVILLLLLFVYIYDNFDKLYIYPLLFVYMVIDKEFLYLFFALFFFALHQKDKRFLYFNTVMFFSSIYIYGLNTQGQPKGHFLDVIGLYSAVFTPIVFIYIFYVLYRRFLTKQTDIVWFISFVPLILSLLLSFRQKINIEEFAPYLIVALPLAAQTFSTSYRVRLKMFRTKYRVAFVSAVVFLLFNTTLVLFNKYLYLFIDKPQKHFAYKMHIAKELSKKLKNMGIECINTDSAMQKRLKFYKINKCNKYTLKKLSPQDRKNANVTISYNSKIVYSASATKINIK